MRQLPQAETARRAWMSLAALRAFPRHRAGSRDSLHSTITSGTRDLQSQLLLFAVAGSSNHLTCCWVGLDQDHTRNFSWLHQGLDCVVLCSSLGISPEFLCPAPRSKHRVLLHLSAQQLPAFGEGAVVSLSAEQTLRKITPLRTEHPGTVTCGTVTSVCVWTDRAKEERKMYGRVFLLIAPAPPCCKTSAWRELQQQVTAPEYEWGQYNLYVALCKWIIAFWLWFTVTGVFCS